MTPIRPGAHWLRPLTTLVLLFALLMAPFAPTPLFAQDAGGVSNSDQPTTPAAAVTDADETVAASAKANTWAEDVLGKVNGVIFGVIFLDVTRGSIPVKDPATGQTAVDAEGSAKAAPVPLIVVLLFGGAIFFTFMFRFITFRGWKHAIQVIRGKYDDPNDAGEISHFRAVTSALSATVGLGNIAGVALAISIGGPGAAFWMSICALFGMASKFSECALAQVYRKTNPDGTFSGGPMYYLQHGFAEMGGGLAIIGKFLAVMAAFMVIGAALGGGNMFQANQSFAVIKHTFAIESEWAEEVFGLLACIAVGLVVIGGIKRIGAATSRIVPFMAALYILGSVIVIVMNIGKLPSSLATIVSSAFSMDAGLGGLVGIIVTGVQRAAFSNEAGLGSAAIAHAAAKTDEPIREGIVAMLEPFIDTVIICMMTALVVVITGTYLDPSIQGELRGVTMTAIAFGSVVSWFPYVLTVAVVLFAYSTQISWCYYGERGWIYLLDHLGEGTGIRTLILFRLMFIACVFIGSVASLGVVIDFSDAMILSLSFPNIIGMIVLSPMLWRRLKDYWGRYSSGTMS